MKKFLFMALTAFFALSVQAQGTTLEQQQEEDTTIMVAAYFCKNDTMTFHRVQGKEKINGSDTTLAHQIDEEFMIVVTDSTDKGYKMELTPLSCEVQGNEKGYEGRMASLMWDEIKNLRCRFTTDEWGTVQHIENWREIRDALKKGYASTFDHLYAELPGLDSIMPRKQFENLLLLGCSTEDGVKGQYDELEQLFGLHGTEFSMNPIDVDDVSGSGFPSHTTVQAFYTKPADEYDFDGDYVVQTTTETTLSADDFSSLTTSTMGALFSGEVGDSITKYMNEALKTEKGGKPMLVAIIIAAVLMSGHRFSFNGFSRDTLSDLLRGLFSVVPENMLDPIRDFNTAQLILMGIIFAYATMAVGQQASGIVSLIHELNLVSMQLAQWIAVLMPVFTVFLTAQLMISHNAQLLTSLLIVIPFAILVSLVIMAVVFLVISRRFGVKPGVLLKKLWPSFILAVKNGLDSDTYALSEKCCIKSLGMQKIFTQRVLPLGLVLYMPASIVGMISFVIFAAMRSGVAITPVWILTAIVFALILLVAAPPIPGVNLLSYVVIIGQLGIGKEYVIAAIIFDMLFGAFGNAANQMMLQLDMILQAERMGLLNRNVLRSDGGTNVTA